MTKCLSCLNPCCNGIYLIINLLTGQIENIYGNLNPCCNGIYLIINLYIDKDGVTLS